MAQRKRVGLITQRSMDRNHPQLNFSSPISWVKTHFWGLFFFLFSFFLCVLGLCSMMMMIPSQLDSNIIMFSFVFFDVVMLFLDSFNHDHHPILWTRKGHMTFIPYPFFVSGGAHSQISGQVQIPLRSLGRNRARHLAAWSWNGKDGCRKPFNGAYQKQKELWFTTILI